MKNLLKSFLSVTILSGSLSPVISCSNSKISDTDNTQEDSISIIQSEIKELVLDFFSRTKNYDQDKQEEDFNIINANALGINSIDEFIKKINNKENVDDQDIVDIINNFIINNKLSILQKKLRTKFSDIFAEDTDDFIIVKAEETTIKMIQNL